MINNFTNNWLATLYQLLSTQKTKSIFSIGAQAYGVTLLAIAFAMAFSADFWLDEAFSLELIQHDYSEMLSLAARDVHPPLYYLILKPASFLICHLSCGYINLVSASKIVSLIPIVILYLICLTYIKREYGQLVAILSSLYLLLAPSFIQYALEIRMYSWALLFVSISFLMSLRLMKRKDNISTWLIFALSSLCAAYTHYFATAAVGIIFVLLFSVRLFTHQNNRFTIIAAIAMAVLYLPWLTVFLQQLSNVKADYWIAPLKLRDILEYVYFVLGCINWKISLVHIILLLYVFYAAICRYLNNRQMRDCILFGIFLPFALLSVGISLSLLIRPIFVARYIFPCLFCFWVAIAFCISSLRHRPLIKFCISSVFILCQSHQFIHLAKNEYNAHLNTSRIIDYMSNYEKPYFISTDVMNYRTAAVLLNGVGVRWNACISKLHQEVYHHKIRRIDTMDELHRAIEQHPSFFIVSAGDTDSAQNFAQETQTKVKKIMFTRVGCPVDIYRLEMGR